MLSIRRKVKNLRIISFFLFLIGSLALILSLTLHNYLVTYNFQGVLLLDKLPYSINCSKENGYCFDTVFERSPNIKNCDKFKKDKFFLVNNKKISTNEYDLKYFYNRDLLTKSNVVLKIEKTKTINDKCILNKSFFNKITDIFPGLIVITENIKKKKFFAPGSVSSINPFFYGEASISNIVKRYPINFVFKPLMYVASIFMILYWVYFNSIFGKILNSKKVNKFTIFGVLSGIFIFLHVLFLGVEIENQYFVKFKKYILLLFILCEIAAQCLLTRRLYLSLNQLSEYVHTIIIKTKIIFVIIVFFFTIILSIILIFFELDKKIDYIFEWNYFLFLLFFYILSWMMWKKLTINPTTT